MEPTLTGDPVALARLVKAKARDLGFEIAGIASAEPFDVDLQRTLDWIERGLHATMAWITPERTTRACHPDDLLPGARSILVVGASYVTDDAPPADALPRGVVARYARGADYHDVMRARLDHLAAFVREIGGDGTRTRPFVDSSPLPERAAAVRAGLGFVGKNTNLLTTGVGSWVLLGAVMTDLALAADPPMDRDCGRCRLCLDACPTDAFPAPFVLDANRCISYLTIEHRGAIPRDLRAGLGERVFGCDICQDVCPWNRASRPPGWPELRGSTEDAQPSLADLLALDADAFRARFRHSPIWRTKRRGLLRNAAVALGNVGSTDDLPALIDALRDPEPLVRGHAAWAIGQIGAPAGIPPMAGALADESDAEVMDELRQALARLGWDPTAPDSSC
jgi:epoxyqueuosine reductase